MSEAAPVSPLPDRGERRLHPLSPLFVLLTQLRNVAWPLVFVVVFGRGSWMELFGAAGAVILALYSLVYSIGFRYRLGSDALFVREGILGRTERHVPYARIQNILQQRNPLHRLFGVTQLTLQSAGGLKPEAEMTVITVGEADRLERVLRGRIAGATHAAGEAAEVPEAGRIVHAVPGREIVRLGLLTNRGVVVLGALVAAATQFTPWDDNWIPDASTIVALASRQWAAFVPSGTSLVLTSAVAIVVFLLTLKLLSVLVAVVTFHGFHVRLEGERVSTEMGLLTRRTASARRDKIQRLLVGESWLARWLGRQWLSCDVAAGQKAVNEPSGARLHWLTPIGTPAVVRQVIAAVAPAVSLDGTWRPLHPNAWKRRFRKVAIILTLVSAGTIGFLGWYAAPLWGVLVAWALASARGWARFAGYALEPGCLAVRTGWLTRQWTLVPLEKGQVVQLRRSPFDRRSGMATVVFDTAGAGHGDNAARVEYLPERDAADLAVTLRRS